jgi:cell division protein YceG involved in septum cleavage
VVTNANMFRLDARRAGADGQLRAGVYDLLTGMPNADVIGQLAGGSADRLRYGHNPRGLGHP